MSGDGKDDVMLQQASTGRIEIWEMDGIQIGDSGTAATIGNEWTFI